MDIVISQPQVSVTVQAPAGFQVVVPPVAPSPVSRLSVTVSEQQNVVVVTAQTATTITGASAYELAVQSGFVGTLSEWLLSLKGADGAPGPATPMTILEAGGNRTFILTAKIHNEGTEDEYIEPILALG